MKINAAVAFSNRVYLTEYYHNSSWLEYGGAPDKAVQNAFVYQIDAYLKQNGKYNKSESKIKFQDVEDCLVIVMSSFSTMTSYENQTKKAINNKGIQEAMVEMLRHNLEIYFIENPIEAEKIGAQVLINKRSREDAEKTRLNLKGKLTAKRISRGAWRSLWTAAARMFPSVRFLSWRAIPLSVRSSRRATRTIRP